MDCSASPSFSILYRIDLGGTHTADDHRNHQRRFSILYRIDLGGTSWRWQSRLHGTSFSILYRIDLGGTFRITQTVNGPREFQYPLSDRSWWDFLELDYYGPTPTVSVSSIGSILVGRLTAHGFHWRKHGFSILYRIDLGGTTVPLDNHAPGYKFQYPLSDRSWWDHSAPSQRMVRQSFQYPLSDRSWWDMQRQC